MSRARIAKKLFKAARTALTRPRPKSKFYRDVQARPKGDKATVSGYRDKVLAKIGKLETGPSLHRTTAFRRRATAYTAVATGYTGAGLYSAHKKNQRELAHIKKRTKSRIKANTIRSRRRR